jgi:DNA modification methylase
MQDYKEFLESKRIIFRSTGITVQDSDIHPSLFPFQRDLTRWALRKGRGAIFADTGLGKSRMQLEFARLTGKRSLIIAPLSVAKQTVNEARKIDLEIHYTRSGDDLSDTINITNYEMISKFDPDKFGTVVLDESSILKGLDGKTRQKLTDMFAETPYKLCCTATPAPNDIAEIANHAEFLGIMSRVDMLATFFVHDDQGWRLKKHATDSFYRWLASWGMSIRKPSDLGYDDNGFILPELKIIPQFVKVDYVPEGRLFFAGLKGIQDRSAGRKATLKERVMAAAELVNADNQEQWLIWCGLNDEGRELHKLIPDSVLVEGQQSIEAKISALEGFQEGRHRVMITKPKIAGFGMNFQHCHKMVFVGLGDSFESYYQCIRRCWRFGQSRPVDVYIVLSEVEQGIYENVLRKEAEAKVMGDKLIENVKEFEREEIQEVTQDFQYETDTVRGKDYVLMLGDSVERMAEIEPDSVGLSVFSPPFMSLYTYSPTERDIGNSQTEEDFFRHFGYIIDELLRVTMPGRNCCVHVAQVPAMLGRDGYIGLKDFRGKTIQAFEDRGWIYHGEVCIDKDPQAQAIRTHSKGLLFVQLKKDASWLRPALADYILVFRKPGENPAPVKPDLTNDEWIEFARPIWYGIRESDTLNVAEGRDENDERHICPLQLGTIERCVRLWSNPGDLVCSPFAGIGSEGYMALKLRRKFVGIELKRSYYEAAKKNLKMAINEKAQLSLLDFLQAKPEEGVSMP